MAKILIVDDEEGVCSVLRRLLVKNGHKCSLASDTKIRKGCVQCNKTGYKGRLGIFDVFQVDGELKRMIHREATGTELMRAAKVEGMTTLSLLINSDFLLPQFYQELLGPSWPELPA
jgi:type II secretory ATPase GspE/PulE/Tfp pilus assembly ATPase PilB-like protein